MARLRLLLRDTSGGAAIIFAFAVPALLGIAAMVIDLSNIYLSKRNLQGIADGASAASVLGDIRTQGQGKVTAMISQSAQQNITLVSFTPGRYRRDAAIAHNARFIPNDPAVNAARVVLRQDVPLFFGRVITGRPTTSVSVTSTATRNAMVAYELGTQVATLPLDLTNTVLSLLAGLNLALTQNELNALLGAKVDVSRFVTELRKVNAAGRGTFDNSLDKSTSVAQVLAALSDSVSGNASLALDRMSLLAINKTVKPGDVIDLGPWGNTEVLDANLDAKVEVYSLLRSLLEASYGKPYYVELNTSLAGVAGVNVKLAGGQGVVRSPWLTLEETGTAVIRTAETRVGLNLLLLDNFLLGLVKVRLPILVEVAAAEARVKEVMCSGAPSSNTVKLGVTPGVARVSISDYSLDDFKDTSKPLVLSDAVMADVILLLKLTGFAKVDIGTQEHDLSFSRSDIQNLVRKKTHTQDILTSTISTLIGNLRITLRVLGLPIGLLGSLTQEGVLKDLKDLLIQLTPGLDSLVNSLLRILGVELGVAQSAVNGLRCGNPMVVA